MCTGTPVHYSYYVSKQPVELERTRVQGPALRRWSAGVAEAAAAAGKRGVLWDRRAATRQC